MTLRRKPLGIGRHLITDHRSVRRAFPASTLTRIEQAIAAGESKHTGQVRFAVEGGLPMANVLRHQSPRERALDVFSNIRVWDTEENCGVLVYLLLADKSVEIVADRGIDRRVGDDAWQAICRTMEAAFREGRFEEGAVTGIAAISELLTMHFPRDAAGRNELPDRAIVL
jgi:uncharacterized membrane protein